MTAITDSRSASVRILDGGVGSELRRRGATLPDRSWSAIASIDARELLIGIHRDYIRAGADIITANTFATSRFVLDGAGIGKRFEEINRAAFEAAREAAADHDVAVAASLSCLPPGFDAAAYPQPDLEYRAYAELASLFAELGVDLILLEMMQHPAHAARACSAAAGAGLPFWAGLSCRRHPGHGMLVSFDDPAQPLAAVVDAVLPFEPAGMAIMHTPADAITPALETLRRSWAGPAGAYAEIPYSDDPGYDGRPGISPHEYAKLALTWRDQGATLLGGCCGTTPEHITQLREALVG